MKVKHDAAVSTAPAEDKVRAGMTVSAAAFKTLSSLYAQPVISAVREIISNAIDAHRKAGVSRPIKVEGPSVLNGNVFSVRDFGPGIPAEAFGKVFLNYFYSEKSDSADMIGGFGLGAKAPLAFSDFMLVTTRNSGMETIFEIALDEKGPFYRKVSERPCPEDDTGLTVAFPVPVGNDDWAIGVAEAAVAAHMEGFALDFASIRSIQEVWSKGETKVYRVDWAEGGMPDGVTLGVVMGGALCPLRRRSGYGQFLVVARRYPIGEFPLTPSRESLVSQGEARAFKEVTEGLLSSLLSNIDLVRDLGWEDRVAMHRVYTAYLHDVGRYDPDLSAALAGRVDLTHARVLIPGRARSRLIGFYPPTFISWVHGTPGNWSIELVKALTGTGPRPFFIVGGSEKERTKRMFDPRSRMSDCTFSLSRKEAEKSGLLRIAPSTCYVDLGPDKEDRRAANNKRSSRSTLIRKMESCSIVVHWGGGSESWEPPSRERLREAIDSGSPVLVWRENARSFDRTDAYRAGSTVLFGAAQVSEVSSLIVVPQSIIESRPWQEMGLEGRLVSERLARYAYELLGEVRSVAESILVEYIGRIGSGCEIDLNGHSVSDEGEEYLPQDLARVLQCLRGYLCRTDWVPAQQPWHRYQMGLRCPSTGEANPVEEGISKLTSNIKIDMSILSDYLVNNVGLQFGNGCWIPTGDTEMLRRRAEILETIKRKRD